MRTGRSALLLSLAFLVMASGVSAQIPALLNYQVMLTDDSDQPLADQMVTMIFSIFDVESGGTALWTETQTPTTNPIGVVSVILGSVTAVGFDFDMPLWLEVEVNGETLSPRREFTAAPYAGHAAGADDSEKLGGIDASEYALLDDLGGVGDGHSLDADDGSPVDALYVDSAGNVGIGTTTPINELHVEGSARIKDFGLGSTTLYVSSGDPFFNGVSLRSYDDGGGYIVVDHDTGQPAADMGALSGTTGGGFVRIFRNNSGIEAFSMMGNSSQSGEPRMDMHGSSRGVVLDMGSSGDNSIQLPDDAINADEIFDEPGVASAVYDGSTSFNGSRQNMDVRSITAPADGYILAIGTAELALYHTYNTSNNVTSVQVGLSDDSSYVPSSQDLVVSVPDRAGTGTYRQVATVHGVFTAYEGLTETIRMYAWRYAGTSGYYRNVHISLLFIPTSRGTVETISARADAGSPELSDPSLGIGLHESALPDPDSEHRGLSAGGTTTSTAETAQILAEILDRLEELERRTGN